MKMDLQPFRIVSQQFQGNVSKRFQTVGNVSKQLFRNVWKRFLGIVSKQFETTIFNTYVIIRKIEAQVIPCREFLLIGVIIK